MNCTSEDPCSQGGHGAVSLPIPSLSHERILRERVPQLQIRAGTWRLLTMRRFRRLWHLPSRGQLSPARIGRESRCAEVLRRWSRILGIQVIWNAEERIFWAQPAIKEL